MDSISIYPYHCTEAQRHLLTPQSRLAHQYASGVTAPDPGCDIEDGPGLGISPVGLSMYALRNVRQLALDGTKWPLEERW
jgi:hypothetical protein